MLKAMSLQKPARAVRFLLNSKALMSLSSSVTEAKAEGQNGIHATWNYYLNIQNGLPNLLLFFSACVALQAAYVPLDFFHCDDSS